MRHPAAQELEPRSYSSAPVGMQFVVVGGGHASGELVFDPSLPIEDAEASLVFGVAGYARTFSLLGRVGRVAFAAPWFDGEAEGLARLARLLEAGLKEAKAIDLRVSTRVLVRERRDSAGPADTGPGPPSDRT